jgi:hypothetical protein
VQFSELIIIIPFNQNRKLIVSRDTYAGSLKNLSEFSHTEIISLPVKATGVEFAGLDCAVCTMEQVATP